MGYIGQKPSTVALTSSDIGADIINADKIADNAISEEHLDATVITGLSALGAEPADTDEFLISDAGTLKRMDYSYIKSSGAFTSVGSSSGTTNVDNVYFDNVFTNTYTRYKIFMDYFLPAQANVELRYKFRNSGSAQGSGYTYTGRARRHANLDNYSVQSGSATGYGVLTYNIQTGNGEHGVRAFFDVYRPGTVDSNNTMHYIVGTGTYRSYNDDSTQAVIFDVASNNYNTTAFDGIMFYFSGGQVDSHKIRIYGVTT